MTSITRWLVLASLALAACARPPDSQECKTGITCPEGTKCAAAQPICITNDCGDGIQQSTEKCDDGNVVDGDGCAKDCLSKEVCGDSVINSVFLRPLPYRDPGQLVRLASTNEANQLRRVGFSYPRFLEVQQRQQVFSDLALSVGNAFTLTGRGDPEQLIGIHASAALLPTFQQFAGEVADFVDSL